MRFKDFLREKAELGEPTRKLTQADFNALPGPSAGNVEDRFKVGQVAFDNVNGLGNTPNGQNVVYLGFAAEMKPADFLNLATIADRSEDAKRFARFIGERVPFASPFLELAYNEKEWEEGKPLRAEVKGHEGRGRMVAFDEVNGSNTMIPVAFILRNGGRARDLSPEFFKALRSNGIVQQDGGKIATPTPIKLGKIFWNGQTL
jgi:hypothetical protein